MLLHRLYGWRRGSVVRTSVFNWRTFPDLRLIYGRRTYAGSVTITTHSSTDGTATCLVLISLDT